jgi:hypothetical protein
MAETDFSKVRLTSKGFVQALKEKEPEAAARLALGSVGLLGLGAVGASAYDHFKNKKRERESQIEKMSAGFFNELQQIYGVI